MTRGYVCHGIPASGIVDDIVIEGSQRVMPHVIPVSPPMMEEDQKIMDKAIQGLNKAVTKVKGDYTL